MNIFEQLIDELKEENLLEETVMENNGDYHSENKAPLTAETSGQRGETLFSADEAMPENKEEIPDEADETGFEFKPCLVCIIFSC